MSSSLRSRPPGNDHAPFCGSCARCHNSTLSCGFSPGRLCVACRTWNTTASTSWAVLPLGMFSIISRKPPGPKGAVVTVMNRMDTRAYEMIADITDSPSGYIGVEGDALWAAEIRRLTELRGATLL